MRNKIVLYLKWESQIKGWKGVCRLWAKGKDADKPFDNSSGRVGCINSPITAPAWLPRVKQNVQQLWKNGGVVRSRNNTILSDISSTPLTGIEMNMIIHLQLISLITCKYQSKRKRIHVIYKFKQNIIQLHFFIVKSV